jgi:TM2 domain-containing membrane protein YozV
MQYPVQKSDKDFVATALLCFFVGVFGIHRFYVGKTMSGIIQLLTLGGLGIWALVDLIVIIMGNFKDKDGLPIRH